MIKILNVIGISALVFAMYSGYNLYSYVPEDTANVERRMEVKEQKKLEVPAPKPKSFDSKIISRMEMIDSSDVVLEDHINSILDKSRYGCMGKDRDEYVSSISSSVLSYTKGNIKLALWVTSMAQVESSYRLNANPKVSTARGFMQVIPRYHPELAKAGINSKDLSTDPAKSIKAGVIVFNKYLRIEKGNYKKATRRYRGLSVTEEEQQKYYNAILSVYNKLLDDLHEYA